MANETYAQCGNCGERLTPRGGRAPRFCPRCGSRVVEAGQTAQRPSVTEPEGTCGTAVASLVLGVIGVPLFCFPFGFLAIFLGVFARMKIEESGGRLAGNGLAIAGIVLGIISSGLWLAFCASTL